jgi:hypothetical protein
VASTVPVVPLSYAATPNMGPASDSTWLTARIPMTQSSAISRIAQTGGASKCEKKRLECGGWNDESEAFCGGTLVCIHCFGEIRRRNTTGSEVA